jgi:hypothetical protein
MTTFPQNIHQLSMDSVFLTPADHTASVQQRVAYKKVGVNRSTFKAGLAASVHRWFRLTPSFGPRLSKRNAGGAEMWAG